MMRRSTPNACVSAMKIGTEKRRYTVEPVVSPVPPVQKPEPASPPAPVPEPAKTHA
jgi:hypothetical protein